jgi:SAM-dependent methyltransferase
VARRVAVGYAGLAPEEIRLPIVPSIAERLRMLILHRGPGPTPMLDFIGAQAFRVVCVAVRLGVFEALATGALSAADVARRVGADERGTALLLEALEALGYLRRRQARYANTVTTARWLLQASPTALESGIPFFESMVFDRWGHLEDSIRRGQPALPGADWLAQRPDGWRIYQRGMLATARMVAGEVVSRVRLPPGARRLLDVGGGHGLYSVRFCRRQPGLSATVFDVPPALDVARDVVAAEGMQDRVALQAGDFWVDALGAGYDAALVFNVLHAFPAEKNVQLLRKVGGAVRAGGHIVIMEQLGGDGSTGLARVVARLQALNYFNDLGAQTYAFEDVAGWLTTGGFHATRRIALRKTPGFSLLLATKAP